MASRKNSENSGRGNAFRQLAANVLGEHWKLALESEVSLPIGNPPKYHRFDLASGDRKYVGEAKSYTWTESGNVPSAKMTCVNEAVFYLSHLPAKGIRFVAMLKDIRPRTGESLAVYYYRTNRHLLNGVKILEIDPVERRVREITSSDVA
ncbi:MAG: hypothetical protein BIFFINMI_00224 [Phycisphaerae bacterium]|nr:hypothetical protein [Phycisphaerae bacterium]